MPWASGSYTRLRGATGWVDDKNAAIFIVASRHDDHDNDLATGINTCLTRDNQAKPTASFLANADNSLDLGSAAVRWRIAYAVTALLGDGAVGAPAASFVSDTNTGLYRIGADTLGIATGGVLALQFNSSQQSVFSKEIFAPDGAVGTPAYNFTNDNDTGIYRGGANTLNFATGGVVAGLIDSSQRLNWLDGTVGAPAFTFTADPDTGFYRIGANDLGVAAGGVQVGDWSQSQLAVRDGAVGSPGYSFLSDADTGLYRIGANTVGFAASGALTFQYDTLGLYNKDGTAANPAYTFTSDSDTGFYRVGANEIGVSVGGARMGSFASGSFTCTLTGMTAGTTGTVFYLISGGICTLYVGGTAITGTSNTTALTMTGLPAICQPVRTSQSTTRITNNGVTILSATVEATAASGTLTFGVGFDNVTAGFTAANAKGLPVGWKISYPIT